METKFIELNDARKEHHEVFGHSGELRPGSKTNSFAYVETANISVSACS